jgi:transcriptional regulator with XRE-family HTH domain
MIERSTLSSKIFELRKKLKLTQLQLGEKVGISGGAISQFEKALNRPNPETLKKLSEVLQFDLSTIAKTKEWPLTSSDLHSARLMLTSARKYEQSEFHGYNTSYDTSHRSKDDVEHYEELILFRQSDFAQFLDYGKRKPDSYFLVSHLAIPGIEYSGAVVWEIQGSSMAPRYPDQSRYVMFPVEDDHWQYATGVHAVWLKNKKLFFKRIISNREGVLLLSADATGEQTTVELSDIASLWKAGQAVHMPPEEL